MTNVQYEALRQSPEYEAKAMALMEKCPITLDWVEYKGETYFAEFDVEKSLKAGRPIIGIGYCATQVIVNRRIDSWHNYSPETFKLK